MSGLMFVFVCLYLTFFVSLVVSLLDPLLGKRLVSGVFRRWCKFLLGLVALGIVVQILTWI